MILFAGSVLQGSVGFAAGLFGIPLLMLTGLSLPDAVAISLVAATVQNFTAAWQLRSQIDLPATIRPMLLRFATLPLGVLALAYVSQQFKDVAGQMVGVIVLAIVAVQWSARSARATNSVESSVEDPAGMWSVRSASGGGRNRHQATPASTVSDKSSACGASGPQTKTHPAWEWLAFSVAGFLLGLCGIGGPPMVLWVLAQNWPMNRSRAFLYFLFASGIPAQAVLLWLAFGWQIASAMLLGLAVTPAVLLGLWVGFTLARLLPDRLLRSLCVAVLILVAISAIATPYL